MSNQVTEEKPRYIIECGGKIQAIHDTMYVLSGRWKISIIACLCYQPMRYSELLKNVIGISGKMLSRELKEMEINQLISRKVLSTQPLNVQYEITEYGASLKELTQIIADWGLKHRKQITATYTLVIEKS
ncbi:helix-turn-helix transcriptional regulator [Pedobacter sp. PAMC26386]|nr:helix-turn-helix transcriptional regulator [Pedobacter sp. PAMC26386]